MTRPVALRIVRRVLIAFVAVVIIVRPSWGEVTVPAKQADIDVIVVLDRTRSMIAEDGPGGEPRFTQVKKDLRVLSRELAGARFAMVTFGGNVVRTELPFTTDTTAFDALVDTVAPEGAFDGAGSKIDQPMPEVISLLRDDAEQHPERRRLVVLLSDGENTVENSEQRSFTPLTEYSDGGAVLGYGTADGGRMLVDEDDPDQGYMTQPDSGDDATSAIDTDNLERVAGELGVDFVHRQTGKPGPIRQLATSFDAVEVDADSGRALGREITWLFGFFLIPLLLWELWAARRTVREVRRYSE